GSSCRTCSPRPRARLHGVSRSDRPMALRPESLESSPPRKRQIWPRLQCWKGRTLAGKEAGGGQSGSLPSRRRRANLRLATSELDSAARTLCDQFRDRSRDAIDGKRRGKQRRSREAPCSAEVSTAF